MSGSLSPPGRLPSRDVVRGPRAIRIEVDAGDVSDGNHLLAPVLRPPLHTIPADEVDEASALHGPVPSDQHLGVVRGQRFQLGRRRLSAHELNQGHLLGWERHFLAVVVAQIEVAVDEIFALAAVKDHRPALALAAGKNERRAFSGDERCHPGTPGNYRIAKERAWLRRDLGGTTPTI